MLSCLPQDQQAAVSGAGLLVIRLDHPYTTLPESFTTALTEGVSGSPLTPMDLSNVTIPGKPGIIRSSAPGSDALGELGINPGIKARGFLTGFGKRENAAGIGCNCRKIAHRKIS